NWNSNTPPEMESGLFKLASVENLADFHERTKRYLGPMHKRAVNFLKEEYKISEERYREHQNKQEREGIPEKMRTPKNVFIYEDLRMRMLAKLPDISDAVYLDVAANGKNSVLFNVNPKEKGIRQLLSAYEAVNREQNLTPE